MNSKLFLVSFAILLSFACQAQSRPYFFFFQSATPEPASSPADQKSSLPGQTEPAVELKQVEAAPAPAPESKVADKLSELSQAPKELAKEANEQIQKVTSSAREGLADATTINGEQRLPQRFSGHISSLYNHGSTAMKSVVDTVQPDISNLGKDISDMYHQTRVQIGHRIEPIGQTIKPMIENAQKLVSPYVNHVKDEVPKLIEQARPTIVKAGEQLRGGLHNAWDKISTTVSNVGAPANDKLTKVENQVKEAKENVVQGSGAATA